MSAHRSPAPRMLWSVVALLFVMVALSSSPTDARQFKTLKRISVSSTGVQGINIRHPVINGNGKIVAFWSDREGLVQGDTNFAGDVFVHNRDNNQTVRVSLGFGGVQTARNDGNLPNSYPEIDIDDGGCAIVYSSDAHNITQQNGAQTADVNDTTDVFLVNWCPAVGFPTGKNHTLHISKNYATGQQANGGNTHPRISGNGRYVLWRSAANNLVGGDSNSAPDIFRMDLGTTGVPIIRVNVSNSGAQANIEDGSLTFDVSDNGNIVAFASAATNLIPGGDTNSASDIFIRNVSGQTTKRINGVGGAEPNGPSFNPSISGDGRFIAFRSNASNLVPNDTNGVADIFVYDRDNDTIERVSLSSEGTQPNFGSDHPSISDNGRWISFFSDASNLVYGDTNGSGDIFLHDRQLAITTRVSVRANGNQAGAPSGSYSAISDNGKFIAWDSFANNIVQNDTNNSSDVFISETGPNSPNALQVVSRTETSASLAWNDNSKNESNMIVQRRQEGTANFSLRATLPANSTTFDESSLAVCTVYYYRIVAKNDIAGSPSNILRVKTLGCPPGPFNLAAPTNGDTFINPDREEFRWGASEEAVTFTFTLNRTGTGPVEQRVLNAVDICDDVRCILPVDAALEADLINGNYTWTVSATNPVGTTNASNNAQGNFVVNNTLPPRSFPLLAPNEGAFIRNPDDFGGFVWRDNKDAERYELTVIHISNNTRLGNVINHLNLTPHADGDGLTCDFGTRECTYVPTAGEVDGLANGTFAWSVVAVSPGGGRTEATNGGLTLIISTEDFELIRNGGFEDDENGDKLPDNWNLANKTGDGRKCNKPNKTFTSFGNCAFLFKSSANENSKLTQTFGDRGTGMQAGDEVQLNGQASAKNLPGNKVKVKVTIKYVDGAIATDKATINVDANTYDFKALPPVNLGIDGPVASIKVQLINKAQTGKVTLDEISLLLLGPDSPRRSNVEGLQFVPGTRIPLDAARSEDGGGLILPPPPPAVDGFRGQN